MDENKAEKNYQTFKKIFKVAGMVIGGARRGILIAPVHDSAGGLPVREGTR